MVRSFPWPYPALVPLGLLALTLALCLHTSRGALALSSDREFERLLEDLGSDHFETREAATRALMEREEAVAALQIAMSSPDAEVRRRVADILVALESKRARRSLARGRALGKDGRAVEMIDRLVCWTKWDTKGEGWEALAQFAEKMIELTAHDVPPPGFPHSATFRQNPSFPSGDFRRYADAAHPTAMSGVKLVIPVGGVLLVRGEDVTFEQRREPNPGISTSIIAASRDVRLLSAFDSVIVAGGDLKAGYVKRPIIVCDGDVELSVPPESGLIIARGKVSHPRGELTGCIIRSENYYQFRNGKRLFIKDGTPDPLGFVKFFELADVGLTAADHDARGEPVRDGVFLKDVGKGTPFASGLRAGDVVTAVDGTKVTSQEGFRRLLRRTLARGGPAITFTVRRAGETLDVPIPYKD